MTDAPERRVAGPSCFGDQEDIFPDMMLAEKRNNKQKHRLDSIMWMF
jgi:hypothetical protein